MASLSEKTQKSLEMALYRIKAGRPKVIVKKRKLSIAAVAEEADVSPALIHNRYPGIAEKIREETNTGTRKTNVKKTQALKTEKDKNRQLRRENETLKEQVQKLLSINARLTKDNEQLESIQQGDNVTVFRPNTGKKSDKSVTR